MKTYDELIKGLKTNEEKDEIYNKFEKEIIKGASVKHIKKSKNGIVVSVTHGVAKVRNNKGKYFQSVIGNLALKIIEG